MSRMYKVLVIITSLLLLLSFGIGVSMVIKDNIENNQGIESIEYAKSQNDDLKADIYKTKEIKKLEGQTEEYNKNNSKDDNKIEENSDTIINNSGIENPTYGDVGKIMEYDSTTDETKEVDIEKSKENLTTSTNNGGIENPTYGDVGKIVEYDSTTGETREVDIEKLKEKLKENLKYSTNNNSNYNGWITLDEVHNLNNQNENDNLQDLLEKTNEEINPPEDIKIHVDKQSITRRGVTLIVTDSNNREKNLSLTFEYVIDKKVDGQWVRVPGWENQIVPALLIKPHSRHVVNWFKDYGELEPGTYRILLPYNGGNIANMDKICISEEFEIR